MSIFTGVFGAKPDPLSDRATKLILAARVLEQQTRFALEKQFEGDEFAAFNAFDGERWKFVITVAALYAGIAGLRIKDIDQERRAALLERVFDESLKWDERAGRAWEDCQTTVADLFVKMGELDEYKADIEKRALDALAFWINLNLYGRKPTPREMSVGLSASRFLVGTLRNYWD
jgi:hypothetical protein